MEIRWERLGPQRGGPAMVADVEGIGRLCVKRVKPGAREFVGTIAYGQAIAFRCYKDTQQGAMAATAKEARKVLKGLSELSTDGDQSPIACRRDGASDSFVVSIERSTCIEVFRLSRLQARALRVALARELELP